MSYFDRFYKPPYMCCGVPLTMVRKQLRCSRCIRIYTREGLTTITGLGRRAKNGKKYA